MTFLLSLASNRPNSSTSKSTSERLPTRSRMSSRRLLDLTTSKLRRSISEGIFVVGDRYALKRALANLAQNAIRYSPADSAITIAAGSKDGWVWTAVEDEGPGIAPEHREQVFERFWRTDKSRSRSLGGSGLGLSIVQQVAQAHSGLVRLSSEVGRGSTFVIWIPALGRDEVADAPEVPDLDTSEA